MPKIDPKVRALLAKAEAADMTQLELLDLAMDAFRVTVGGIDVTRHTPVLEPEVQKRLGRVRARRKKR